MWGVIKGYEYTCTYVAKKNKLLQIRAAEKNGKNCSTSTLPPPLQIKCSFPNKVAYDRSIFFALIAFFFNQLTTKSRDIPHRCQDWQAFDPAPNLSISSFRKLILFTELYLVCGSQANYLPFSIQCLSESLSVFFPAISLYKKHHTTQIKKLMSSKSNFKKIYFLIKDSILSFALLTFIETAVWPFMIIAGSLRSPTI